MNEYTVGAGDTPMGIAERYTGSLGAVSELVNANKDRAPMMSQGHLTFHPIAFAIGDKIKLPANWPAAPRAATVGVGAVGVGAPPFQLVGTAKLVDPAAAEAACQGGWSRPADGSWPGEMTTQAENINGSGARGDFFIYYEGTLYKFLGPQGWITGVCSSLDPSKLQAVPGTPPIVLPGPPGGPGTNVGLKDSSMPAWAPWAIGAVAVAAALGLAYVLWSGQAPGQPRALSSGGSHPALPAHRATTRRNPTRKRRSKKSARRSRRSRR